MATMFFLSQHLKRIFLVNTQLLSRQSWMKVCTAVLCPQKEDTESKKPLNLLITCLSLLLPIMEQHLSRCDRDLVHYCTERLDMVCVWEGREGGGGGARLDMVYMYLWGGVRCYM